MIATILALILFIPMVIVLSIAFGIGGAVGGKEGIETVEMIFLILIEGGVCVPLSGMFWVAILVSTDTYIIRI